MPKDSTFLKLHTVCIEMVSEISRQVVFAAENFHKTEVDSEVLLEISSRATKKLKEITDDFIGGLDKVRK